MAEVNLGQNLLADPSPFGRTNSARQEGQEPQGGFDVRGFVADGSQLQNDRHVIGHQLLGYRLADDFVLLEVGENSDED